MSKTSSQAGEDHVIGFDMGGTSTDVSHYQGEFERTLFAQIAGIRMRAPMLSIHTVAAVAGRFSISTAIAFASSHSPARCPVPRATGAAVRSP